MATAIEQTECSIPKVYVFNVPPRSSSTGHRAADWPKESLWSGRLRLVSAGDKCSILLEHTDKDGLFARCPVDSKATVEQVTDSSRYFVIKVSDGKGHSAYLGVAFEKREEAFEFKVALQTAQNRSTADKKATDYFSAQPAVQSSADASIEVNLTGKFAKKKDAAADGAAAGAGAVHAEPKKGGFAIAPPKASEKKSRRQIAQSHGTGAAAAGGGAAAAAQVEGATGAATPAPAPAKAAKSSAAPAAAKPATALDQDATLLEAFGAAPPPNAAAPAAAADPLAFFSAGK